MRRDPLHMPRNLPESIRVSKLPPSPPTWPWSLPSAHFHTPSTVLPSSLQSHFHSLSLHNNWVPSIFACWEKIIRYHSEMPSICGGGLKHQLFFACGLMAFTQFLVYGTTSQWPGQSPVIFRRQVMWGLKSMVWEFLPFPCHLLLCLSSRILSFFLLLFFWPFLRLFLFSFHV